MKCLKREFSGEFKKLWFLRLTVTRGGGEEVTGEKSEGFAGTITKDTPTITKGGVETGERGGEGWSGVEEWGERAENCT